jgi:Ca-activated chloride channel family protein
MSANDFPDTKKENMILLITDGVEECGGDPCAAREKFQEKQITLRPYIIGIGLSKDQAATFSCVGQYFSAEDPLFDKKIFPVIREMKQNRTTAQVNLLDLGSNPTETDVNMTFYDQKTGRMVYNYVHALNEIGKPDTILSLFEGTTYKLLVHTIPPVEKKDIKLTAGKHNTIVVDAPQGQIELAWAPAKNYQTKPDNKMRAVVRKGGDMNTLHVQNINAKEKYIVGTYDLEVLTLPRTILKDVKVNQSLVKKLVIDLPGTVTIKLNDPGEGSILKEENGKLTLVTNLDKNKTEQVFKLQPGNYRVEFRARSQKLTIFSIEKKFTVVSENDMTIDLMQ